MPPPPPTAADGPTQEDLLVAIRERRDVAAFERLFRWTAPRVKAYLMRLGSGEGVAEELAQEVMLTVWQRAETFDETAGSAASWIFAIARNRRIDHLRRELRPEIDPLDPAFVPDAEPRADTLIEARQQKDRLRTAIDALPHEQADLLRGAYYTDLPHRAMADLRSLPLGTVKSRLRLALNRLRRDLLEETT